jgi:DNA-directed RNA polymerase
MTSAYDLQLSAEFDQITRGQQNLIASIQGGVKTDVLGNTKVVKAAAFSTTSLANTVSVAEIARITETILKVTKVKQGLREVNTSKLNLIKSGPTAKALGSEVVTFLTTGEDLESKMNTFVNIALAAMLDGAFLQPNDNPIHEDHNDKSLVVEVCRNIGKEIELLARLSILRETNKQAFNKVFYSHLNDQVLGKEATHNMVVKSLNDHNGDWTAWSTETVVRVGMVFFGMVFDSYTKEDPAPFEVVMQRVGKQTYKFIQPNIDLWNSTNNRFQSMLAVTMVKEPMVAVPADWTLDAPGGYYTNGNLGRDNIVRGYETSSTPSQDVLDFLNNLQHVGYKVNPFTIEVANTLAANGVAVGKFLPQSHITAKGHKANPWNVRATRRTELTLKLANKYANTDVWYLPWSFDFRGRVYPIPTFMTPQGTDFDKSLILLAEGEAITEEGLYWLHFHLATTYGMDKATMDDRQEWAKANGELFTSIAKDPINTVDTWSQVEEPWMFLAACKEYLDVVVNGQPSHLMVATDATCSGIQVLSGLSHDHQAAALVNVIPDVVRHDAYGAVAAEAMTHLTPERQAILANPKHARKVAKHVVMTVPYNAAQTTNYKQVFEALTEIQRSGVDITFTKEDATAIGQELVKAMAVVLNGPMAIRDWFNKSSLAFVKGGNDTISWTTPSGFTVVQDRYGKVVITMEGLLLGKTKQMQVTVGVDKSVVNHNGHKTSFAPNLIHSLDASLLHIAFKDADYNFSVIHDSILTGVNNMGTAVKAIKGAYTYIFSDEVNFIGQIQDMFGAGDPPCPPVTFDSSVVLDSPYFFS